MDEDNVIQRLKDERQKMEELASLNSLTFDTDLYSANKFEGYEQSIPVNDENDNVDTSEDEIARKMQSFTAPKQVFKEALRSGEEDETSVGFNKPSKIIDREDDYRRRRLNRIIFPERVDPFQDKTPGKDMRTCADIMREEGLKRKEEEVKRQIAQKKKEKEANKGKEKEVEMPKKRNRWDMSQDESGGGKKSKDGSEWDLPDSAPVTGRWDATLTPGRIGDATPSISKRNRWDDTPTTGRSNDSNATPSGGATPGATPAGMALDATLRHLSDRVKELGAGPLFNSILPLLMRPTLEDQERQLLVMVIDRVLYKLYDLADRIADCGFEFVHAKELMRVCFELLGMLKAQKRGNRRAIANTFGYIAKVIGPNYVLATLLNNLKAQECQNCVCTTVAIAIVAETCLPFTVLPALMNEYRVPELNVQNGVLKSLSFLFEYIGQMGADYIHAVTPLLENALMDGDLVHRQTAACVVKHMALGVAGLGCEDALIHLMNYVWPNIFETSPHVINAVMEAIEGMRVALGAAVVLNYCLQGLFHPARKVREVHWKIYNSLYTGAQDALVAVFPVLEDENNNVFSRPELHIFI